MDPSLNVSRAQPAAAAAAHATSQEPTGHLAGRTITPAEEHAERWLAHILGTITELGLVLDDSGSLNEAKLTRLIVRYGDDFATKLVEDVRKKAGEALGPYSLKNAARQIKRELSAEESLPQMTDLRKMAVETQDPIARQLVQNQHDYELYLGLGDAAAAANKQGWPQIRKLAKQLTAESPTEQLQSIQTALQALKREGEELLSRLGDHENDQAIREDVEKIQARIEAQMKRIQSFIETQDL